MLFHNEWSNTQLVTKNDVTGDSIQSKVSSKAYLDNYDAIFGSKNQKTKQKSVTELNWDGNEDRGRYGEDESNKDEIPSNSFRPG
jgi:flagellar hook assembly protein FlgD|tara:strand:+ start:346 stop:600 length:255 start_codon:yes stop_codon:yes gene_type:complete